ncbi:hypothetical protein DASB73_008840 [Starmerella bacillaris]|uniref:Uncharacterized protein n=1 Tax=Starmerella bacillaris TaxID=1247836 RepID=A0AAV5RFF1_STABA|nr:hypothetical protein DASB73_008840 [Starmerella bacillaris]
MKRRKNEPSKSSTKVRIPFVYHCGICAKAIHESELEPDQNNERNKLYCEQCEKENNVVSIKQKICRIRNCSKDQTFSEFCGFDHAFEFYKSTLKLTPHRQSLLADVINESGGVYRLIVENLNNSIDPEKAERQSKLDESFNLQESTRSCQYISKYAPYNICGVSVDECTLHEGWYAIECKKLSFEYRVEPHNEPSSDLKAQKNKELLKSKVTIPHPTDNDYLVNAIYPYVWDQNDKDFYFFGNSRPFIKRNYRNQQFHKY